jgi:hypothetical protein
MRYRKIWALISICLVTACSNQKPDDKYASAKQNHSRNRESEEYHTAKKDCYFPFTSFVEYQDATKLDTSKLNWYSGMLRTMKEPVLYRDYPATEVIRLTCLRTFHAPFAIRVERDVTGAIKLVLKISDGAGGYESRRLIATTKKSLSEAQWKELEETLNSSGFWDLLTQTQDLGCDGSEWIVEGVQQGKYHVVERWAPKDGSSYRAIGDKLIELSETSFGELY